MKCILSNLILSGNIFDILGFIVNTIIAGVAIIAVIISFNQFNKNIKILKIEEIFSLFDFLGQHYSHLFNLYILLLDFNETTTDINLRKEILDRYNNERNSYLKDFDINDLNRSILKLEMLSKVYLNNNIQLHVLSFSRMTRHIIAISIYRQWFYKEMFWKDGFPNLTNFNLYLDKIEHKFVKMISLKKQNINLLSRKHIRNFCENEFKNDIGIKIEINDEK